MKEISKRKILICGGYIILTGTHPLYTIETQAVA